jgi:hypothetical protein
VRIAGDGLLKCGDGLRHLAGLQAGEAKIMLDEGVRRLHERGFAQGRDCIGRLAGLEERGRPRQQLRDVPGVSRVW